MRLAGVDVEVGEFAADVRVVALVAVTAVAGRDRRGVPLTP
ncbi:hypothetical protein BN903_54 [Halorubrum sp. AJ67]|nr:hypothetical protein BN903_54 [Halorubrum sp. AJ67]